MRIPVLLFLTFLKIATKMKNVHCDQSFMKLCIFDLNDINQIEIYLTRNKFLILISIFEQTQLF